MVSRFGSGNKGGFREWRDDGRLGRPLRGALRAAPVKGDHNARSFFGGTMYAGNDGGIWKSTNYTAATAAGSVVWTPLNSTLAITQFYPGHAVNPSNENDAFGGTQDNGMEQFSGSLSWTVNTCGDGGSAAYYRNTPTNVDVYCTSLDPP